MGKVVGESAPTTGESEPVAVLDSIESHTNRTGSGESHRNDECRLQLNLLRPLTHRKISTTEIETFPETLYRTVGERLLPDCTLDQSSLIQAGRDISLRSKDGRVIRTKSIALKNMSAYFQSAFRCNTEEVAKGEFKTDFNFPLLKLLVGFSEFGGAILSLQNIQQVFIATHYFQVTSFIEPCKEYLSDHLPQTAVICLRLASLFEDMEELAKQAAICCAEKFDTLTSTILDLPAHYLATVISQDALRVPSEDEVVKLVVMWSKQKLRTEREILHVLEQVRYPHLTLEGFASLQQAFRQASKLEVVRLCLNNRFDRLPEQQLARRRHYVDHMHLIWSETQTVPRGARSARKPIMKLKMTCLRCKPGKILAHKLLCHIPEMRNGNHKFEFVPVMNSLHLVTHSAELADVVVYKQLSENGCWVLQNKIPRVSKIEEFGVCEFRGKIILTMFAGYTELIRNVEIDTFRDSNVYRIIDFRHPPQTSVSAPQMSFHDDWLVFLRQDRIHLSNPREEDIRELLARNPASRRGIEALAQFRSFVRCDNYLYVYKDMVSPSATFRRVRGLFDKVLKVNIDSQEVEKIIEVRKPLYSEFDSLSRNGPLSKERRVRYTFVSGSKLMIALQESDNDVCRFVQLFDDEDKFGILIDVRCTDYQHTYTRRLERIVPIHIHDCGHATLLSHFCSTLLHPEKHALLERLSYYL